MDFPFSQRPAPTKGLTNSLCGRIRAIKDASDNGSPIDSSSDMGVTGDSRHSVLAKQSDEGSFANNNDEKHEEETASDTELDALASESNSLNHAAQNETISISFGALVKAQISLDKRNRSNDDDSYTSSHKSLGKKTAPRDLVNDEALERRAGKKDTRDFVRTSKHAPAELSSKKAVSRKREVVPTQRTKYRDPRFEPLSGAIDEQKTKKNYSFLDMYRNSEISELQLAIRKTKDSESKEKLKRAVLSMESRKKAQKVKEQQQEVLRKHRKEEKEKIEQGKRPFYLKKADQRKMALIERFESMKGKQVDKAIERRRKKKASKERKGMPDMRRA